MTRLALALAAAGLTVMGATGPAEARLAPTPTANITPVGMPSRL